MTTENNICEFCGQVMVDDEKCNCPATKEKRESENSLKRTIRDSIDWMNRIVKMINESDADMYDKVLERAEQNLIQLVLTKKEQFVYRSIRYHGMTQKELAERLGITQPTVSRNYCRACDKIQPLLNIITQAVKECIIESKKF